MFFISDNTKFSEQLKDCYKCRSLDVERTQTDEINRCYKAFCKHCIDKCPKLKKALFFPFNLDTIQDREQVTSIMKTHRVIEFSAPLSCLKCPKEYLHKITIIPDADNVICGSGATDEDDKKQTAIYTTCENCNLISRSLNGCNNCC